MNEHEVAALQEAARIRARMADLIAEAAEAGRVMSPTEAMGLVRSGQSPVKRQGDASALTVSRDGAVADIVRTAEALRFEFISKRGIKISEAQAVAHVTGRRCVVI